MKMTLEQRVTRLEKLIKNEATKEDLNRIPNIVREFYANDDVVSQYVSDNSKVKIFHYAMPARARSADKFNEIEFRLFTDCALDDESIKYIEDSDVELEDTLKKAGFDVSYILITAGKFANNTYAIHVDVELTTNVKPLYRKPDADSDAAWETGLEPDNRRAAEWGRAQRDNHNWW